jgi:hypothetical protein
MGVYMIMEINIIIGAKVGFAPTVIMVDIALYHIAPHFYLENSQP